MQWRKSDKSMTLEQADLQVMKRCKIPMDELLRENTSPWDIPPLWSVLSYAMLIGHYSYNGVMRTYRSVQFMAENTALFYHREAIPKAKGGVRWLQVPHYTLREHQERIHHWILKALPVDPRAFAYRPGVSFRDCAKPHVDKSLLIHLDLKNFFGSVKEDMVYTALLRDTGYPPALCRFFAKLCCLHGSLPQGAVTSPALSNIVFRSCDEALARLADKYAMDYTRYSDDLFFSGDGLLDAGQVIGEITALLEGYGFRINPEKTRVRRRQHRQSVLGLTVNEGIRVSRDYRRKLEKEMYYLERFGENCTGAREAESYLRYMQKLLGKVSYVVQIDPENEKFCGFRQKLQNRISRYEFEQRQTWVRAERLQEKIAELNLRHGLSISLEAIRKVYGDAVVAKLAENEVDTLANIQSLIDLGFGPEISTICNRYGILLWHNNGHFRWELQELVSGLGTEYLEILKNDMSLWETLL